ncbi:MAG: oligosaccharide flippase family protein [Planctomycetota bacterium]
MIFQCNRQGRSVAENSGASTMGDTLRNDNSQVQVHKQRSLKLNALSNWFALGVNVAIGFFLTPAIFAHLGEKRFGMWMLVSSIVGYFGVLRLGVGTGVFRYVPLFRGKGDDDKVGAIVSTGVAFYTLAGFVIFMALFLCASPIANFFQGGQELANLIRVIGLAAALQCPSQIFDTAMRGYEGFVVANSIGVFCAILRAGALVGCILMGYGLVTMGWAIVVVNLLGLVARGIALRNSCKEVHFGIRQIGLAELKMLVCFGAAVLVGTLGEILAYQCPKQIVGKVVSLEALSLFGVAALLITYYRQLIYALVKVLMPRFGYLSGQDADSEILRLFLHGSRYVAIVAGAIALLLWVVGPSFLRLWIKNDNINQAVPALIILAAGAFVLLSHRVSAALLFGFGKQKTIAAFQVIEGIFIFALSLALSYKYGITGVAVGIAVPLILIRGVFQTVYVCRLIEISFRRYYWQCIFKPWIITAILVGLCYWLGITNLVNNWPFLFLISGLIMVVYGAAAFIAVLESEERHQIKRQVLTVLSGFNTLAEGSHE